jgi:Putative addiction module component
MGSTLETLKRQIDDLAAADKAEILRMLVADLDKEGTTAGVAEAWVQEARRRNQELSSGTVQPIPASQVFAKARERLRR